jgi:hypothetical protein
VLRKIFDIRRMKFAASLGYCIMRNFIGCMARMEDTIKDKNFGGEPIKTATSKIKEVMGR